MTTKTTCLRPALEHFRYLENWYGWPGDVIQRAMTLYARAGASPQLADMLAAAWVAWKIEDVGPHNVCDIQGLFDEISAQDLLQAERALLCRLQFELEMTTQKLATEPMSDRQLLALGAARLART